MDNEGPTNGSIHTLIKIDPTNWNITQVSNGIGNNTDGQFGFIVPVGMYPLPDGSNNVYLDDQQQLAVGSYNDVHGRIWEVNLDSGAQSLVATGDPGSTKGYQYVDIDANESFSEDQSDNGGVEETYGNPEDLAVDSSGNLITLMGGAENESPYEGIIANLSPNPGSGATVVSAASAYTQTVASLEIDSVTGYYGAGTIYVGIDQVQAHNGRPGHLAWILAINPNDGSQFQITSSRNLSLVAGMVVYQSTGAGDASLSGGKMFALLRSGPLQIGRPTLDPFETPPSSKTAEVQPILKPSGNGGQQIPATYVKPDRGSVRMAGLPSTKSQLVSAVDSWFSAIETENIRQQLLFGYL